MNQTYTIWADDDGHPHTLIAGEWPPRFVNGEPWPDCKRLVHEFRAGSWDEAVEVYNKQRALLLLGESS